MQRLEVGGAVRPIYGSLGVKWLMFNEFVDAKFYHIHEMLVTAFSFSYRLCGL